jgi:hypothetical protein
MVIRLDSNKGKPPMALFIVNPSNRLTKDKTHVERVAITTVFTSDSRHALPLISHLARRGKAWHGKARQGWAWLGAARHGMARQGND